MTFVICRGDAGNRAPGPLPVDDELAVHVEMPAERVYPLPVSISAGIGAG
jgi:hypothetical protein